MAGKGREGGMAPEPAAGRGAPGRKIAAAIRIALMAAALAALAALPYLAGGDLQSFINLDDDVYVLENPFVLRGLTGSGARWAFTSFHAGNWHPLTWLSHMLDVSLYGTAARGHHLTSVALHAVNTALLFLACVRLTGAVWAGGIAAALFGLHPLRVESVAWVAERKDVLAGLFFLLLLLAYERYARRGGAGRYLLVAALLALGLMAKPMLVTAPFVLLLLDFWPLGRTRAAAAAGGKTAGTPARGLLVEKLPLLGLCAASGAVTFLAQSAGEAVRGLTSYTPALRLTNALVSCAGYLGKTLWPASLAVFYPHPLAVPPWWEVSGALLLLGLVTAIAVRSREHRPHLAVGWLWFLGMLVPVIGLVQVGAQAMADRYTYLPAIGLSLLLAWSVPAALRAHPLPGLATAAGSAALLGALLAMSGVQAGRWRNSETLYRHALAVTSGNWLIHNNLANVLYNAGRYEQAVPHYRETLRLRPNYAAALQNLGITLTHLGRFDEAIALFVTALEVDPDNPDILDNLGFTLVRAGRPAEAVAYLERALRLRPGHPRYLYNLQYARSAAARSAAKAAPPEDRRSR